MIPLTSLAWQEVEGEDGVVRKVPMVPSWGIELEYLIKSSTGHPTTPKNKMFLPSSPPPRLETEPRDTYVKGTAPRPHLP